MNKIVIKKDNKAVGSINYTNPDKVIVRVPLTHSYLLNQLRSPQPVGEDEGDLVDPGTLEHALLALREAWIEEGYTYELEDTTKNSVDKTENYSPTQPRDDRGRWTSTGGGSSSGPSNPVGGYDQKSPYGFSEKLEKDYGKQATWSDKESKSIDEYIMTYGALKMNTYLRGKKEDSNYPPVEEIDEVKSHIEVLDKSMRNSLVRDTTLYRGFGTTHELEVGTRITDKAYVSTTVNESVALDFAKHGSNYWDIGPTKDPKRPVVMQISAKKGQKGIWPQLSTTDTTSVTLRSNEQEYLLPRGQSFIIKSVHDMGDYELVEVDIE